LQRNIDKQCFQDLDELPQYNWQQINKGNYTYLFKEKREYKAKELEPLSMIYRALMKEYINEIGIEKDYKAVLMKQQELAILKCDYVITQDPIYKTLIEIAQGELKEMIDSKGQSDYNEIKAYIDKQMGFQINLRTTSVKEFNSYINLVNKVSNG